MAQFMETFEKFQSETSQTQASSKQQLDEVENQINSFKSSSEGQVESVMEDNDKNIIVFEWLHQFVYFRIQPRNILSVIKIWCVEMLATLNNWFIKLYKA